MSGSLTTLESNMMFAGVSVSGIERRLPERGREGVKSLFDYNS